MQVERHKHLGIALELAPDHPAIHGLLGQVADNGQWRMPQAVSEDYLNDAEGEGDTGQLSRPPRQESRHGPGALAACPVVRGKRTEGRGQGASGGGRSPEPGSGRSLEEAGVSKAKRPMDDRRANRRRA